jgi:lysozyme family protein
MAFSDHWRRLARIEGGFVDDPDDSGGKTRWGVTEALARRYGYTGDMRELPLERAEEIAKAEFWDPMDLDAIESLAGAEIAWEMLDAGYNMGARPVSRFLQRALNALNLREDLYEDLFVDGRIGPKTIDALDSYLEVRGRGEGLRVLWRCLDSQQAVYYLSLVERREKDERFFYGWIRARTGRH